MLADIAKFERPVDQALAGHRHCHAHLALPQEPLANQTLVALAIRFAHNAPQDFADANRPPHMCFSS